MLQKPISVLVVEDDKFILGAYKTKFENEGFKAKFTTDGIEAANLLKTFKPDVIILDILIPKGDGFTVLEEIKKNKTLKDIPIIMATNLDDDLSIKTAGNFGVNEYVIKSRLSLTDLVNRINEIKGEL